MRTHAPILVEALHLSLGRITLPMGLIVNELTVQATDLRVDRKPYRAHLAEEAKFTGTILQDDLLAFMELKAPPFVRSTSLRLEEGKIHLGGLVKLIVDLKASAVCSLVIQDCRQVLVTLDSVDMIGVAPKQLIQKQLDDINPLFDAEDLPFPCRLLSVAIEERSVVLQGECQLPDGGIGYPK